MAGEVLLINPRLKHRRKNTTKRRRARRHNPFLMRKRHVRRRARRHNPRRHRRHVRCNPAPFGLGGGQLMHGVMIGVGGVATEVAGDFVQKWIPASWALDADLSRIGTKAAVGIAGPMLAKMLKVPKAITTPWLIGGIAVTVLDVFRTYIAPKLGLTLKEYEQVSSYEQLPGPNLSGSPQTYDEVVY